MGNSSIQDGIRQLRRMKGQIDSALLSALDMTVSDGVKLARVYSSGRTSLASLRAAGHPYARRHKGPGAPSLPYGDPGIINQQSPNGFRQQWRGGRARFLFGSAVAQLRNDDPVAEFLDEGTETMIRRPIREKLEAVMQPDLERKAQTKVNMVS